MAVKCCAIVREVIVMAFVFYSLVTLVFMLKFMFSVDCHCVDYYGQS